MMRAGLISMAAVLLIAGVSTSKAAESTVTRRSAHPFATTLDRLEASAKEKGFMVFARLDHEAAATSVGQKMPQSTVLVIGNPRLGTERFIRNPTLAIDLPLKVLVWADQSGAVSVTYNSAQHMLALSQRHGLAMNDGATEQAKRTEALMAAMAESAAQ